MSKRNMLIIFLFLFFGLLYLYIDCKMGCDSHKEKEIITPKENKTNVVKEKIIETKEIEVVKLEEPCIKKTQEEKKEAFRNHMKNFIIKEQYGEEYIGVHTLEELEKMNIKKLK